MARRVFLSLRRLRPRPRQPRTPKPFVLDITRAETNAMRNADFFLQMAQKADRRAVCGLSPPSCVSLPL